MKPGLYLGQCAQFCGIEHAKMLIRVYVDTPRQFDARGSKNQQQPVPPATVSPGRGGRAPVAEDSSVDNSAAAGRRIFETEACMNCHTIAGTAANGTFGPDLTHLMSRATIAAGAAANTPENLRAWIQDPEHLQTRRADARHATQRPANRRSRGVPLHSALKEEAMADQTLPDSRLSRRQPHLAQPRRCSSGCTAGWSPSITRSSASSTSCTRSFSCSSPAPKRSLIRIQLAIPHNHFVSPEAYNELFTMHGTTMVFLVGMPILFGFANYLVPLMIGARDMAFPRLNAFSFWLTAFGGLLLYFSFIGGVGLSGTGTAPDVGWFAYAPLTAQSVLARPHHRLLGAVASSSAASAASARPSTSSPPSSACAAAA